MLVVFSGLLQSISSIYTICIFHLCATPRQTFDMLSLLSLRDMNSRTQFENKIADITHGESIQKLYSIKREMQFKGKVEKACFTFSVDIAVNVWQLTPFIAFSMKIYRYPKDAAAAPQPWGSEGTDSSFPAVITTEQTPGSTDGEPAVSESSTRYSSAWTTIKRTTTGMEYCKSEKFGHLKDAVITCILKF